MALQELVVKFFQEAHPTQHFKLEDQQLEELNLTLILYCKVKEFQLIKLY